MTKLRGIPKPAGTHIDHLYVDDVIASIPFILFGKMISSLMSVVAFALGSCCWWEVREGTDGSVVVNVIIQTHLVVTFV